MNLKIFLAINLSVGLSNFASHAAFLRNEEKPEIIPLITFGDKKEASHSDFELHVLDDPVMGGESHSESTLVDEKYTYVSWNGTVVDVPKLSAPGFCSVETTHYTTTLMNDVSSSTELSLKVRSKTPSYQGFKISFATKFTDHPIFSSFKSDFFLKPSQEWQFISIPFDKFTSDWSAYTGNSITPCSADHKEVCPKTEDLETIKQITISAEGVNGPFDLDVGGIFGTSFEKQEVVKGE